MSLVLTWPQQSSVPSPSRPSHGVGVGVGQPLFESTGTACCTYLDRHFPLHALCTRTLLFQSGMRASFSLHPFYPTSLDAARAHVLSGGGGRCFFSVGREQPGKVVDAWCLNAELLGVEQCPSLAVFILGPFSKSLPCIPLWIVNSWWVQPG